MKSKKTYIDRFGRTKHKWAQFRPGTSAYYICETLLVTACITGMIGLFDGKFLLFVISATLAIACSQFLRPQNLEEDGDFTNPDRIDYLN